MVNNFNALVRRIGGVASLPVFAFVAGASLPTVSFALDFELNASKDIWTTSTYSYTPKNIIGIGGGVNNDELRVGGWGDLYYSLLKFDLAGLTKPVRSATLKLYSMEIPDSRYSPVSMYVDRVTSDWNWENEPLDSRTLDNSRLWWDDRPTYSPYSGPLQAPIRSSYWQTDVTGIVNEQILGTFENHGIQLRPTSNSAQFNYFASSEHVNQAWQPKLVLEGISSPRQAERISMPPASASPFNLPVETSAKGLILIAHGYNSSPEAWAVDLADKIRARLTETGNISDWDIVPYDWESAADTHGPDRAVINAVQHGAHIGKEIRTLGYENVHFIAHSAGSHLIDAATRQLHSSVEITNTFLDAYTPALQGKEYLGSAADWAEQYYASRDFPFTHTVLKNAYNVDVGNIDPDFQAWVAAVNESNPQYLPELDWTDGHQWPHEWYRQTVLDPQNPISHGWGFPISLEEGSIPDHSLLKRGENIRLSNDSEPPIIEPQIEKPVIFGVSKNFDTTPTFLSETGTVTANSTEMMFENGSPVWSSSLITLEESAQWLALDFKFDEGSDGEGLFAVYWDDEPLGTFDERFVSGDYETYYFELGVFGTVGGHLMSFRLDSYNELHSLASIKDVRIGIQPVPLPSGIIMFASGLAFLGWSRKKMLGLTEKPA